MEKETSTKEQTSSYLMGMLREKDDKIGRLKSKLEKLKKECSEIRDRENKDAYMASVATQNSSLFLNQISRATGNRLDSVDDCIVLIKRLAEEQQKKVKRDFSKDEIKEQSPLNSDKQRRYDVEIEELKDTIYDMEMKLSLQERKFKSRMKQKDDEIEELNDEIEVMKSVKQKDAKAKARLSDLEETIDDLNTEMQLKIEEIKMKDKKIKELIDDKKNVTVDYDEISRLKAKHDQEIRQMRNEFSDHKQKLEQQVAEYREKDSQNTIMLDKRATALETMKGKIRTYKDNIRDLEDEKLEVNMQLTDCQKKLETEKEASSRKSTMNEHMKNKIDNLEREMADLRATGFAARVQRSPPTPPFLSRHKMAAAENHRANHPPVRGRSNRVDDSDDDDDDNIVADKIVLDSLKRACPNCQVIFSEHELGKHLKGCLENSE